MIHTGDHCGPAGRTCPGDDSCPFRRLAGAMLCERLAGVMPRIQQATKGAFDIRALSPSDIDTIRQVGRNSTPEQLVALGEKLLNRDVPKMLRPFLLATIQGIMNQVVRESPPEVIMLGPGNDDA